MNKRLSVIITWRDRAEIALTLEHNVAAFKSCCREVIIVNGGGDPHQLRRLSRNVDFRLKQIDLPSTAFNKALGLNIGTFYSLADAEWLLFLDADNRLDRTVLEDSVGLLKAGSFINISRLNESRPETQSYYHPSSLVREINHGYEIALADGRRARVEHQTWSDGARTGLGLILVEKRAFVQINGANANLKGWGFEDTDIQLRLQLALNLKRVTHGYATHLTHSDRFRDLADAPHLDSSLKRNMERCLDNYARGDFLGTYDRDVALWKDRVLESQGDGGQ